MNKKSIMGLSLLLVLIVSTKCFAYEDTQKLKVYEQNKTVSIEDRTKYKNSIQNEIVLDGILYNVQDIQEQENKITLTRDKEEIEEQIVNTSNKNKVLELFEKEKQVSEDGYHGSIKLQEDSIELITNESYLEEYKVELKREYNNVAQNELNDIPKTIQEQGTIYYLVNPEWNVSKTQNVDGQEIPILYNGTMNYEGVKQRRVIKNYIAKVTYKGTLQKEQADSITFTVTYKEVEKEENYIPVVISTTAGIIFFSGLIILRKNNISVYRGNDGKWKLVKKIHLSKSNKLIDITPNIPIPGKYKIALSNKLYNQLLDTNVTIKYFDKQYIYEVKQKEFEIYV